MQHRVAIIQAPPVAPEHGIRKGRVFDVVRAHRANAIVLGDAGEEVTLHPREYTSTMDPVTEPPLLPPKPPACAHPGCTNAVTPDDHCAGCDKFICETHSTNAAAGGFGHNVEEHWEDESALTDLDIDDDDDGDTERDEA